nr:hypothetical protein 78 - Synechococcus sp [Synechococcus sp.]
MGNAASASKNCSVAIGSACKVSSSASDNWRSLAVMDCRLNRENSLFLSNHCFEQRSLRIQASNDLEPSVSQSLALKNS